MAEDERLEMVRALVAHGVAGTMDLADEVVAVPAAAYTDPARFEAEKARIFRRLPLMLAPACELPEPGCYKAMDAVGVPVLLVRQRDGEIAAFLNMCSHRGNPLVDGRGKASRFTCGYHGWSFGADGRLLGVAAPQDFGPVDKAALCLRRFPCAERAGLIFVILDPASRLSIDEALCGYDRLLSHFGFRDWTLFAERRLPGPNWKTAFDGYLDFYHLPVLHAATFGSDFFHRANYFAWGPHQRLANPSRHAQRTGAADTIDLSTLAEADWPEDALMQGVWTIFPHVSIASFYGGGVRGAMVSQLFPGPTVGESVTTQFYLMERPPATEAERQGALDQFALLETVVAGEDYRVGRRQHEALQCGLLPRLLFGRNERGGQVFHQWVDRVLAADDDALPGLFRAAVRGTARPPMAA